MIKQTMIPLYNFKFLFFFGTLKAKWLPLDTESLMITCARDGQVRLLELPIGKSRKIGSHQGPIHKLAIHRETPHIVLSCGEDGKILSIDIRESRPKK